MDIQREIGATVTTTAATTAATTTATTTATTASNVATEAVAAASDVTKVDEMDTTTAVIQALIAFAILSVCIVTIVYKEKRSKGRVLQNHVFFVIIMVLILLFLPTRVDELLFSPLSNSVVGAVFPLYESIIAICTIEQDDDEVWLQYWVVRGAVSYFIDVFTSFAGNDTVVLKYYYPVEFFFFTWLMLPSTDGAKLIYDFITEPYLVPLINPVAKQLTGFINNLVATVVSATHIWVLWAFFMILPKSLKRFATLSIGSIYPFLSSVVALSTPDNDDDVTRWLTYWSCYIVLYLVMKILEEFLGKIIGFYTVFLFTSVYLFLPMFNGSEKFFRNVLVPLAGQQEMLMLKDAFKIQRDILKKIPENRHEALSKKISDIFSGKGGDKKKKKKDDGKGEKQTLLNKDYKSIVV